MFLRDFQCNGCSAKFEELVSSSADRTAPCHSCGKEAEMVMSATSIGVFATLSPTAKAQVLRKRSHNHTMGELKKEPERHGFAAADRRPWNIRKNAKSPRK